jgi:hypothetical protein
MSTDTILDQLTTLIYNFFTYKIPMFLLPFLLKLYNCIQSYFIILNTFFQKVFYGIRDSLNTKYLCFFKLSDTQYFPYIIYPSIKFSDEPQWIYDCNENIFSLLSFGHHVSLSHLPFIGASLNYISDSHTELLGDLSDWIVEQRINSSDSIVPLQVLVAAWNYNTNKTLSVCFKNLYLTVTTDDGEDHTYSLENEEEIIINTEDMNTEDTNDEDTKDEANEESKEQNDKIELPTESSDQSTEDLKEE